MSKQIIFFSTESDKVRILEILNSVFDAPVEVTYNFSNDFNSLTNIENNHRYYITELAFKKNVLYELFEYADSSKEKILNRRKSPILEYDVGFKNNRNEYVESRFYCRTEDKKFSKKVSIFFIKLKKEFLYVKKWKIYVSKNIDIANSLFFIPNRTIKISKEDLEIK